MPADKTPHHSLHIEYGKLKADAIGRPAVVGLVVVIVIVAGIGMRAFGLL